MHWGTESDAVLKPSQDRALIYIRFRQNAID